VPRPSGRGVAFPRRLLLANPVIEDYRFELEEAAAK